MINIINTENSNICKLLFETYLPNSFKIAISTQSQLEKLSEYPFFVGKEFNSKTSVFICKDFSCSLPLNTIDEIRSKL